MTTVADGEQGQQPLSLDPMRDTASFAVAVYDLVEILYALLLSKGIISANEVGEELRQSETGDQTGSNAGFELRRRFEEVLARAKGGRS
jgi:hypothetical protein